jgi:hypothetical protein
MGCSGGPEGKWDEVQAIQHQPFIYVQYNGSPWAPERTPSEEIALLIKMLGTYRLGEDWAGEKCYSVNPCVGIENPEWNRWDNRQVEQFIDGPRMYAADGVVHFSGNFANFAHSFRIDTNHRPTIDALLEAIAKNPGVPDRDHERVIYVDAFPFYQPIPEDRAAAHASLVSGVPAWVDNKPLLWEAMGAPLTTTPKQFIQGAAKHGDLGLLMAGVIGQMFGGE